MVALSRMKRGHLICTALTICDAHMNITTLVLDTDMIFEKRRRCLMTERFSWTTQLLDGRGLELPPVQQEGMLCLCSPVTGCVSAGVWSTAPELTEVHETPLHRTWTAAQRREQIVIIGLLSSQPIKHSVSPSCFQSSNSNQSSYPTSSDRVTTWICYGFYFFLFKNIQDLVDHFSLLYSVNLVSLESLGSPLKSK